MTVHEINVFLYSYVELIGTTTGSADARVKMADLLKLLPTLYPAPKLFDIYMSFIEVPTSSRFSKLVALQEIKGLIGLQGVAAFKPDVHLPNIVALLSDVDVKIKSGTNQPLVKISSNLSFIVFILCTD